MSDKSLEGHLEFLRDIKYPLDFNQIKTNSKNK